MNQNSVLLLLDQHIINSIVDFAIIATDLQGRIIRWNTGACRILEWSADEMLGQSAACFFTPEDVAIDRPAIEMEQAMLNGKSQDERWHLRKGGERFWASGEMMLLRDDSSQHIGFVKVLSDRTTQKLAVTDIVQQNQHLEHTVVSRTLERDRVWSNSPDLLVEYDRNGFLLNVNPAFKTILGYKTEEAIGKSYKEFIHPDDHGLASAALVDSTVKPNAHLENRWRHKEGGYRWIDWASSNDSGTLFAIGRDITEDKKQAEALQLAEDSLRQAQKMEAVGQLTGGLAHDFNNMLAGIMGNLEMLKFRLDQDQIGGNVKYVDGALTSVNRAAALTHRLLAFSRRQTLDPKPTDVNLLVLSMEDLIRRTIGFNIYLETVLTNGLWSALCDPNQLESALLNLAINSRDAMPDGGRLTIETANALLDRDDLATIGAGDIESGDYIRLCVSDTGVGMTTDVVKRAIDPFFTTKPIGQGTGLGLSMIYGFVKQSKGHLRILSQPGEGTTVQLLLPRRIGPADTQTPHALLPVMRIDQETIVLLVEDEDAVRKISAEMLGNLGYVVVEASNANDGLRRLRTMPRIDLLVTDVGLPNGMNGRQLADAGREIFADLKVLFITGFAETAASGVGLTASGMQVLIKPFSLTTFATKVRAMIES